MVPVYCLVPKDQSKYGTGKFLLAKKKKRIEHTSSERLTVTVVKKGCHFGQRHWSVKETFFVMMKHSIRIRKHSKSLMRQCGVNVPSFQTRVTNYFWCLQRIQTHDLCNADVVVLLTELRGHSDVSRSICRAHVFPWKEWWVKEMFMKCGWEMNWRDDPHTWWTISAIVSYMCTRKSFVVVSVCNSTIFGIAWNPRSQTELLPLKNWLNERLSCNKL